MHSVYKKAPATGSTSQTEITAKATLPAQDTSLQRQRALGQSLQRFTTRPVNVQRSVAAPALRATALYSGEVTRLKGEQQSLQRAIGRIRTLPSAVVDQTFQRQPQLNSPHPTLRPQTPGDWVTVMRQQAELAEGRQMDSRTYRDFMSLQRQVAGHLSAAYRQDRQPATVRTAEYAGHLAALQRHPISEPVARAVIAQVPIGERATLQRAVDDRCAQEALQRQQDAQALQLHSLQRQLAELDEQATKPVMERIHARRGSGSPLPAAVQRHLEQGLNHDLSAVRIHDDAEADKLAKGVNAVAFTTGMDIYFQSGKFNPNTQSGLELLAHEVTHTVQQSQGKVGKGIDPDAGLEREAQTMGQRLAGAVSVNLKQTATRPALQARPSTPARPVLQRKAGPTTTPSAATSQLTAQVSVTVDSVVAALIAASKQLVPATPADPGPAGKTIRAIDQAARQKAEDRAFWQAVMKSLEAQVGNGRMEVILQKLPAMVRLRLDFALLGGTRGVTYAAFVNQLAMMSYSDRLNLSDTKGISATPTRSVQGQAQGILSAAGYEALPAMHGLWGLQIRVFRPKKGAKNPISTKTIVAFRGTEGVVLGISAPKVTSQAASQKKNESFLDTMTDFAPYPTGYSQYEANEKQIINPLLKTLGSDLVAVGHSLGGALAQIAVAKNPARFSEVFTFQGAKIQKADVERAAKANRNISAQHFSINGDVVPGSGQASIPGTFHKFNRASYGPVSLNTADGMGGHNNPIMVEMLRQFSSVGILSAANPVAAALIQGGSRDPNGKVSLTPTSVGTKGHSSSEGAKQAVFGQLLQRKAYVGVIQNNLAYNIYAERAMNRLKGNIPSTARRLQTLLTQVYIEVTGQKLAHTPTSLAQLDAVLQLPDRIKRVDAALAEQGRVKDMAATSPTPYSPFRARDLQAERDALVRQGDLTKIDPAIIAENKARLQSNMIHLWYSVNPTQTALYAEVVGR